MKRRDEEKKGKNEKERNYFFTHFRHPSPHPLTLITTQRITCERTPSPLTLTLTTTQRITPSTHVSVHPHPLTLTLIPHPLTLTPITTQIITPSTHVSVHPTHKKPHPTDLIHSNKPFSLLQSEK
jgi:hypothetical protein